MSLLLDKLAAAGKSSADLRQLTVGALVTCRGCGCDDTQLRASGLAGVASAQPENFFLLDIETPTGICTRCALRHGLENFFFCYAIEDAAA